MATYKYTRTLVDGAYDIDAAAKEPLSIDIKSDVTVPSAFRTEGTGAEVNIIFDKALTTAEEAALATVVADYK